MKNNKSKMPVICREDIQNAIAEYLIAGGTIKKIRAGKIDSEVLKNGFSEIEDDFFWIENEAPTPTILHKVQNQDLNEV